MSLDSEIQDLEHRLAQRKLKVRLLVRASGRRAMRSLISPAGLIGAAALGFFAITGVTRRQHYQPVHAARSGKLAGIAGIVTSAALALVQAQFGGPAQIAQLVLSKLKKRPQPPRLRSPGGDSRPAQTHR
jgi:hypothetical protein